MANLLPAVDGIRLPLGTRINPTRHATWGGNPYPKEMREMVLQMWQNGGGGNGGFRALETAQCNQLREQRKFPHMTTCRRWIEIHRIGGHVRPKIATGNKFSKREIHGQDLINLAFYRHIYPKAYIDEVRAYVHNRNPTEAPYSMSQVHRAEVRLGLWLKVGSSTADEAYRPINLSKRRQYWKEEYPDGIKGIDGHAMGLLNMFLIQFRQNYGWILTGLQTLMI